MTQYKVRSIKKYDYHIFICLGKRCSGHGSEKVLDAFKRASKSDASFGDRVKVTRSGCMKGCKLTEEVGEYSPVAVVYPEGVWYRNLSEGDVEEIIESHIGRGEVVERLLLHKNF